MRRLSKNGFTLVELLVVIAMIMILAGAVTTSVSSARERAKVARATAECREITNAILAYENYVTKEVFQNALSKLNDTDASKSTLNFILGEGGTSTSGQKIPVLYNGALAAGKHIVDPWGVPYKLKAEVATGMESDSQVDPTADDMTTTLYLPNHARLNYGERGQ